MVQQVAMVGEGRRLGKMTVKRNFLTYFVDFTEIWELFF